MLIKGSGTIVTGAGSGLGRGIAEALLAAGAKVRNSWDLFIIHI